MTSWQRGKENETEGQAEQQQGANQGDLGEQIRGGAKSLGGKVEQGLDNVGDTLSGKQHDLAGTERDAGKEAQTWVEHRGDDVERGADQLGRDVNNTLG